MNKIPDSLAILTVNCNHPGFSPQVNSMVSSESSGIVPSCSHSYLGSNCLQRAGFGSEISHSSTGKKTPNCSEHHFQRIENRGFLNNMYIQKIFVYFLVTSANEKTHLLSSFNHLLSSFNSSLSSLIKTSAKMVKVF